MRNAVSIANAFIARAAEAGVGGLSANKLNDLVYMAHGWQLGTSGEPLLRSRIWAHRDGIVLAELFEAGCVGGKRVGAPLSVLVLDEARGLMTEQTPQLAAADPWHTVLAAVWRRWGETPAYELRELSRQPGGPWDLIWNDESRDTDAPRSIPHGTIQLWFRAYLAQIGQVAPQRLRLGDTQAVLVQPDPRRLRSA